MTTTYEVEITKTAIVIPSPGGDLYPDENPDNFIFSAIQGTQFTVDLLIKLYETTEVITEGNTVITTTQVNVDDIACSLDNQYTSVSFNVTDSDPMNYTVRLIGNITNAVTGETYTFVLPTNDPSQGFPISTTSISSIPTGYLAVVSWSLPTIGFWRLLSNSYSFNVNPDDQDITKNMSQYVYWDYTSAVSNFTNLVSSGEI